MCLRMYMQVPIAMPVSGLLLLMLTRKELQISYLRHTKPDQSVTIYQSPSKLSSPVSRQAAGPSSTLCATDSTH
jgi:hypothetical protein